MRCDKCCHWDEESREWEARAAGLRQCMAIRERWEIQDEASKNIEWKCASDLDYKKFDDDYAKSRREALTKAKAFVQDGSEYHAELFTGPDFFCALFRPKL